MDQDNLFFNTKLEYSYPEACTKIQVLLDDRFNDSNYPDENNVRSFAKKHKISYNGLLMVMRYQEMEQKDQARIYPGIIMEVFEILGYTNVKSFKKIFFQVTSK